MPHGMCLLWQPWLVILWAGSDLLIVTAYFSIPFALLRVLRKRDDIKQRKLVILFASFIMLCGVTHLLSIVTLWIPIYPFVGMVKLATGIVSATTAIFLFRLVPTLVSLPSLKTIEDANSRLTAEVAAHEDTLAALRGARDGLELKIAERTAELEKVNEKLSVAAREAIHRSHNLIAVVTSMARQSSSSHTDVEEFTNVLIGRLSALADATATVIQRSHNASANLKEVVEKQLSPLMQTYPDRVHLEGPDLEIDSEAAQQLSLAMHELATNAQKHGSLVSDRSRISLSYAIEERGERDQKRLVLTWKEDTGEDRALPEKDPVKQGFGSRLLTQIIPSMLDGESSHRLIGGQLIYELDVPLSAVTPNQGRSASEAFVTAIVDGNFRNA
jgi:two-component sensor histidine kinase